MSTQQIVESMSGTADGNNKTFALSQIADPNTLQVLVADTPAPIESIATDGVTVLLTSAPSAGMQPLAVYLYSAPDDIDLTTLAHVKARAEVSSSKEDGEIQRLITSFSQYVMTRTSRDALNRILSFTKMMDGNGASEIRMPEWPVVSIAAVKINNVQQIISSGYGVPGIGITTEDKYIGFVGGAFGRFPKGRNNLLVSFNAGYAATPADLEAAVCECVAINLKRKQHLDMKSMNTSTQGSTATTTYRDWEIPPHEEKLFNWYTRRVVIS